MSANGPDGEGFSLPKGSALLDRIFARQDGIEADFKKDMAEAEAGVEALACYEEMGTVLGFLDRMASCWWGCSQGDHLIEYLCGRAEAQTFAALRLMRLGLYDEALLACRGIGEIANLLYLFRVEEGAYQEWVTAPEGVRRSRFSPVLVRRRIEATGGSAAIDEHRYGRLSGIAAHVSPATRPQAHNMLGRPGVGIGFQLEGALVCINETALALALVTVTGSFVLGYDEALREEIHEACRTLVGRIGKFDLAGAEKFRAAIADKPEFHARLSKLRSELVEGDRRRRDKLRERYEGHQTPLEE